MLTQIWLDKLRQVCRILTVSAAWPLCSRLCLSLIIFNFLHSGRIPVRLYVCSATEDFDELEDAPEIDSWDKISYINHPVEVLKDEGKP